MSPWLLLPQAGGRRRERGRAGARRAACPTSLRKGRPGIDGLRLRGAPESPALPTSGAGPDSPRPTSTLPVAAARPPRPRARHPALALEGLPEPLPAPSSRAPAPPGAALPGGCAREGEAGPHRGTSTPTPPSSSRARCGPRAALPAAASFLQGLRGALPAPNMAPVTSRREGAGLRRRRRDCGRWRESGCCGARRAFLSLARSLRRCLAAYRPGEGLRRGRPLGAGGEPAAPPSCTSSSEVNGEREGGVGGTPRCTGRARGSRAGGCLACTGPADASPVSSSSPPPAQMVATSASCSTRSRPASRSSATASTWTSWTR